MGRLQSFDVSFIHTILLSYVFPYFVNILLNSPPLSLTGILISRDFLSFINSDRVSFWLPVKFAGMVFDLYFFMTFKTSCLRCCRDNFRC